jgi:hypothetical protein
MAVKLKVDDSLARERMKKLLRLTGKSERTFIREQAGLMAETCARATPPFVSYRPYKGSMGSGADKKQGMSAVIKDLNKVFSIREDGYINFLIKRFGRETDLKGTLRGSKGEYSVDSPLVTLDLDKAKKFYESKRQASGRPSKGTQADSWSKAFVSKKMFDKMVKDKFLALGMAKASFAKAVVQLNPKKKATKWISRHFGRVNTSIVEKKARGYSVVINASAKGLQYVTNKINGFSQVRMQMAKKKLEGDYRRQIRKSGFKR